ncbi:hypothetical protein OBBRIDRAFT_839313 [Obba rivulosa]|uniref:Uncharacterized protein n=1 Tax=Obba rivulosa TaxID=1052685 RepID=A0A8E2DJQ5_9APHY|nr:hypothetical protein OBBRIDRAFT_839313 [Obba rivulosa]
MHPSRWQAALARPRGMGRLARGDDPDHEDLLGLCHGRVSGVHAIGEIWADIFWVIAKLGVVDSLFPLLRLLAKGTVPAGEFYRRGHDKAARADAVQLILTGGENHCDLGTGFTESGLGQNPRMAGHAPWGGGMRTNVYQGTDVPDAHDMQDGGDDDDNGPPKN